MKQFILTSSLLLLFCTLGIAQRTIGGKITDAAGNALPGASVRVKNANVGTVADINGAFTIQMPKGSTTLIFSYTGYDTNEMLVGASDQIAVVLKEGILLSETVVTALGVSRSEKSLGYSVSAVEGEKLSTVRDPNIVNQLAGRAAGVQVIGSSGNLGSSARITIRGIKSINGNNQPLFVVDGVPMDNSNFTSNEQARGGGGYDYGNAIQDINPNDIENVSVLKGQAAAALYGSRGANGVIMITTKKGSKSHKGIGVTVGSSISFEDILVLPKYQNKYGGGVDLYVYGRNDGNGYYKTPVVTFNSSGDTTGNYGSFDLVPNYAVDESFGTRYATSTEQHFQHLSDLSFSNGQNRYSFYNGFGSNESNLHFRDWNTWDEWDAANYQKSRLWESSGGPSGFYELGTTLSNNISFEGGTDRSTFRLSYNNLSQKGIMPNSHLGRHTLGLNGSFELNPKLNAFASANYVSGRTKGRSATGYDGAGI